MEAIKITVTGTQAYAINTPVLTAGTVGQSVEFIFDEAWEGLSKTAVFRAGGMTKDVVGIGTDCTVPWEVMEKTGCCLHIGVYGTNADGTKVIPTVWTKLDPILPGADPSSDESTDPTLPVWEQISKAAVRTVNGSYPDENGNVETKAVLYSNQALTDEQQDQARKNIGAAYAHEYGIKIISRARSTAVDIEAYDDKDDTGSVPYVKNGVLSFLGDSDTMVRLTRIADGKNDWDAATVGQLNAAVGDISTALDTIISMQEELTGV